MDGTINTDRNIKDLGNLRNLNNNFLDFVNLLNNNGIAKDNYVNIFINDDYRGLKDSEIETLLNKNHFMQPYLYLKYDERVYIVHNHYFSDDIKSSDYKNFYSAKIENYNINLGNYIFYLDDFNDNEDVSLNPNFDQFLVDSKFSEIKVKDDFSIFYKNNEYHFCLRKPQKNLFGYYSEYFYKDFKFTFTIIFITMLFIKHDIAKTSVFMKGLKLKVGYDVNDEINVTNKKMCPIFDLDSYTVENCSHVKIFMDTIFDNLIKNDLEKLMVLIEEVEAKIMVDRKIQHENDEKIMKKRLKEKIRLFLEL